MGVFNIGLLALLFFSIMRAKKFASVEIFSIEGDLEDWSFPLFFVLTPLMILLCPALVKRLNPSRTCASCMAVAEEMIMETVLQWTTVI